MSPAGSTSTGDIQNRGVAQSGSARALGAWGRGFESLHPDSSNTLYVAPWSRGLRHRPFTAATRVRIPAESLFSFPIWAFSSVGQSGRLITGWSGVQVPEGPQPFNGPVAQLVRAPACHAGGRGFEPLPGRHLQFGSAGCFGKSFVLA